MDFAAVALSSNSVKGEDSKYIGFDMLKSKEDKDAIFHLHFCGDVKVR